MDDQKNAPVPEATVETAGSLVAQREAENKQIHENLLARALELGLIQ